MARATIYVPDDLKRRMDERGLNWSAVAQEAFEAALANHPLRVTSQTPEEICAYVERAIRFLRSQEAR